jgi:hypothetical protein
VLLCSRAGYTPAGLFVVKENLGARSYARSLTIHASRIARGRPVMNRRLRRLPGKKQDSTPPRRGIAPLTRSRSHFASAFARDFNPERGRPRIRFSAGYVSLSLRAGNARCFLPDEQLTDE